VTPVQVIARLERVRRSLRWFGLADVLLWTICALAFVLGCGAVARAMIGTPDRSVIWLSALAISLTVAWWRWRAARPDRVQRLDAALWAERHAPDLRYALVTLAERERADDVDPVQRRLAAFMSSTAWEPSVNAAMRRETLRSSSQLAGVALLFVAAAYPWGARRASALGSPSPAVSKLATPAPRGRVLAEATLLPPPYTSRAERTLEFGQTVSALAGSLIRIDGAGPSSNATLLVQESSDSGADAPRIVATAPRGDGWRGDIRIGSAPLALRLRDAVGERWVLVTPVADSAPVATLNLPATDTLVFDTTAKIRVAGTIHDDIGLRDARIEYIISSGGGEQFTFKSGAINERRGALGRDVSLATTLDLGALKLKPGDLMHVRLTAHDGNTLSGPSLGASETRTIRIPRADERDSVAIEQLPPTPVDKSVLSQRQLLMLTERLVARITSIDRATMLAESQRIGSDQARLRKQVSDIVFSRLGDNPSGEHVHYAGDGHEHTAADLAAQSTPESVLKAADAATGNVGGMLDSHGDETPVVAVNRPLLEAYNAMWDATRALQGGVPREAIDPMKRALAAIQRARSAERVYLRGTPPAAVVDLVKIRLVGTDSAQFEQRRALNARPPTERRIAERVLRALSLIAARDDTALDSLRLVRLDALGNAPKLAAAVGDAIDALEHRRDATDALLRARRFALAPWRRGDGASLWLGGVP
jgi:hypothetical protein